MDSSRSGPFVAAAAWMAFASSSVVCGFGPHCESERVRVTRADTIVVGSTISVERVELRPTRFATTARFRVEGVLKGKLYKTGDTIISSHELYWGGFDPTYSSIRNYEGPCIVFVNRDDQEWFGCTAPAEDTVVARIRRQIEVMNNAPKYLTSKNDQDIRTVLEWIERTYVRHDDAQTWRADWSQQQEPDRETILRYLIRHVRNENDDLGFESLRVLSRLHPPEAFELFINALDADDDGEISVAAQGLAQLGDERAVPRLIDRHAEIRAENHERWRRTALGEHVEPRKSRSRGWGGLRWNTDNELQGAILSFDNPLVRQFISNSLAEGGNSHLLQNLAHKKDPRALEPLLRSFWAGDWLAGDWHAAMSLDNYDDERIVLQARERMYDHPLAPRLLAKRGDPEAREFMLRLIRQGHLAGANWAGVTRDESAKADLIRSLSYYSDDSHVSGLAYALGRIRAFDVVQSLLEKDFSDMNTLSEAIYMFWGLADIPRGGPGGDCRGDARRGCMHDRLHETARRERWSQEQLQLAAELLDAVEPIPKMRQFFHFEDAWTPPKALPDMPDPLDKEAITVYLRRNTERCRQIIREGSAEDKSKILKVAWHSKVNLLNSELAAELLVDPDWIVRNAVLISSDGENFSFTPSQIRQWTLMGGCESTRRALGYITGHPKPEYAPIVTKVLFGGRHLFDEILFRAIIETDATECADLLRAYLENEHFALRYNAAVTLIHLGDEAGESVLAQLQPNRRGCGECIGKNYFQDALKAIE